MRFRIGRAEARIHFGVLPLLFWCVVAGETTALLLSAISLTVHECAHAIAAKNTGKRIARVTVYPFGAVMTLDKSFGTQGEWVVAAAGPAASFAVSGMLKLFELLTGPLAWSSTLIRTNLLIALLNLLPAFPLDGGRIARAVLLKTTGERAARRLLLAFTALAAAGIFGTGIYFIFRGVPAWTMLALPPFLVLSAIDEWKQPDAGIVARVMERREALKAGFAEKAQIIVVSDEASVKEAMNALSSKRLTILRVQRGSRCVELEEGALLDAAAKFGMHAPLKIVISRLTLP